MKILNIYIASKLKSFLLATVCVFTNRKRDTFVRTRTWAALVALTITLSACAQDQQTIVVNNQGILREIMMEQKLTANASLADYKNTPNFYALGALEGLAGEILILNGRPLNSIAKQGKLTIERSFDKKATLLVSSEVSEWNETSIDLNVTSLKDLQSIIAQKAKVAGINTNEAFPFMIKGSFEGIEWHVINAAEAKEQNHEAFKEAGLKGTSSEVDARILGFYSEKHEGVFTHHGSFLHLHFINEKETEMGHVDNLKISGNIKLMMPKIR